MCRRVERVRVRWIDTDTSGRIHFTAAFRWLEIAEIEFFREHGLMDERERYPRRNVEAEYLRPLRFDDAIELELVLAHVGRSSLRFEWTGRLDGEVALRGTQTIVYVGDDGRPASLPDNVRQRLAAVDLPK
jgi:acyl-CoA thioester hydrolase